MLGIWSAKFSPSVPILSHPLSVMGDTASNLCHSCFRWYRCVIHSFALNTPVKTCFSLLFAKQITKRWELVIFSGIHYCNHAFKNQIPLEAPSNFCHVVQVSRQQAPMCYLQYLAPLKPSIYRHSMITMVTMLLHG